MPSRWLNPEAFYLVLLIPVVWLVVLWVQRSRRVQLKNAFAPELVRRMYAAPSRYVFFARMLCDSVAIMSLVLALARWQYGTAEREVTKAGIELILVVDVSESMMAEDVAPSRLELVKSSLVKFLDLGGGDAVGLLAFAGNAFLLSPLTTDKNALKMYIEGLSPRVVSTQGTDFAKALTTARDALDRGTVGGGSQTQVTQAVVFLSDGEDHNGESLSLAAELSERGIKIFTIAVGTENGGPIPLRDLKGELKGYKKSPQTGDTVISRVKGDFLNELAQKGGGSFHHLTFGGMSMKRLRDDLNLLEKQEFDSSRQIDYAETFTYFLLLGFLAQLVSWWLASPWQRSLLSARPNSQAQSTAGAS